MLFVQNKICIFIIKKRKNRNIIMKNNGLKYPISDLIFNRRSLRAISDEPLNYQEIMSIFEAAQWAQSSYNNQPWRFIYALKGKLEWNNFFELLYSGNKVWCKNAAMLIVVISKKTFDNGKLSRTHSFDTGAACQNMSIQGSSMGLVVHAMGGFDYDKARILLNLSEDYNIEVMFAVGKKGDKNILSEDLQKIEGYAQRKPLAETVFEGKFFQFNKE